MKFKKTFAFVVSLFVHVYAFAQTNTEHTVLYETVIADNKNPEVEKVLLLSENLDGANHSIFYNEEMNLTFLLSKAFSVLESMGVKLTKADMSALLKKDENYQAGKMAELKNAVLTTTESEEYKNLNANLMVVSGDATEEQIAQLRQRRIQRINETTSADKLNIFQISEPFYYNKQKNAFVILLVMEPGSNNFYVCNYTEQGAKWVSTNKKALIYQEQN